MKYSYYNNFIVVDFVKNDMFFNNGSEQFINNFIIFHSVEKWVCRNIFKE